MRGSFVEQRLCWLIHGLLNFIRQHTLETPSLTLALGVHPDLQA